MGAGLRRSGRAQGLLAAGLTTELVYEPHSLHALLRAYREPRRADRVRGRPRLRDGSSFVTRRALARQSHGVILNLSASFQRVEDEPEAQRVEIPDVAAPGTIEMDSWIEPMIERSGTAAVPPDARAWIRITEPYLDTPLMHAVAHAYTSDDLPPRQSSTPTRSSRPTMTPPT